MHYRHAHLWGVISLLSLILTTQGFGAAYDINNGSFELYDYNSVLGVNTPAQWKHINYTAVVSHFIPHPSAGDGNTANWLLDPCIGLFPYQGDHFLVLSTGDVVAREPCAAEVEQTITVEAGNTLAGVYFFGTCDYPDFNDSGRIKLVPVDSGLSQITVLQIRVGDVGRFSSMKGWKRFGYTFEANQAGTYDLVIGVYDAEDIILDSYFAVDGLVLCGNASGGGDINLDCTTDFEDFALMAEDWLCDCNDPNNYNDPNDNCRLDVDLTRSGLVDTNDLQIMSQHWLEGIKEE